VTEEFDTITAALGRAVANAPDQVFLDCEGVTLTFREADELSTRYAHGLAKLGVGKGDPVALMLDNNADHVMIWLAANKLGAISAPVNTAFRERYLSGQLADCGAAVVVAEDDYAERVRAVAADLPAMRHLLARGQLGALLSDCTDPIEDTVEPSDTALLVYTSGTTGPSKGCMISHNQSCRLAWNQVRRSTAGPNPVLWTPLPLFHMHAISGTIVRALIAQCRASLARRFSVSNFWPEVERCGATYVGLLGSMAVLIANAPDCEESGRCFGQIKELSAAPMPPEVGQSWERRFGVPAKPAAGYGMTEAATITSRLPTDPPAPPNSCGRTGLDFDVRIVDDMDREVPRGEVGEIVCRPLYAHIMFQGYWNKPAETVKAWRNLWFHTGDLGRMDEGGYLYFADRKKDYIRRRGENISSIELENVFRGHPAIRDVAVHAVLSPLGEDDVKVTAELREPGLVSERDLCVWAIERVPYFAVPLYIEFREALPRTESGKIQKGILRDEGKTATTWDRSESDVELQRR
jgi:crotonobetaine/carnitine-CoA ligase